MWHLQWLAANGDMGEDGAQGATWHAPEGVPAFHVILVAWHWPGPIPPSDAVAVDLPEFLLISVGVGRAPLVLLALLGGELMQVVVTNMCDLVAIAWLRRVRHRDATDTNRLAAQHARPVGMDTTHGIASGGQSRSPLHRCTACSTPWLQAVEMGSNWMGKKMDGT